MKDNGNFLRQIDVPNKKGICEKPHDSNSSGSKLSRRFVSHFWAVIAMIGIIVTWIYPNQSPALIYVIGAIIMLYTKIY
ncbi:MAG: hypothetical protein MJ133_07650 [Lachnospiraceae bacterium]|nr:hypothetical protein [Lachnospiraceae bacterium]